LGNDLWWMMTLARQGGHFDLADVFEAAWKKFERADRREAQRVRNDSERWDSIHDGPARLLAESLKLREEQHPAGDRMHDLTAKIMELVQEAKRAAWSKR
jgi:hypothetical protein